MNDHQVISYVCYLLVISNQIDYSLLGLRTNNENQESVEGSDILGEEGT